MRYLYPLLCVVFACICTEANAASPFFIGGHSGSLTVCESSGANGISSLLKINDADAGNTETWSLVMPASHGAASVAYSTTSTGGTLTPVGLTYTPTVGYSGTDSFSVRIFDGTSADTTVVHVTVNTTSPVVAAIGGPSSVCVGATITLTDATPGGVWSVMNAHATVSGGVVTGVSAGADTVNYTVNNGCGTTIVTAVVTVNPLPVVAALAGPSSECIGDAITLTDATPGGVWSATNAHASVAGGVVTGVSAGVDTIKYAVTNSCGTMTATRTVTVNGLPAVAAISGASAVCVGANITLTDATPGGTWSVSNTHASVAGGVVTGATAGVDTIMYSVTTSCGTTTVTKSVTVNPLPDAGTITGDTAVCVAATITLSDAMPGGAWSVVNAHASVSGGVVTGVTAGMDTVRYIVTTSCGVDTALYAVVINGLPDAGMITGATDVCEGATIALTDTVAGGVWSSANANASVDITGNVTGMTAGADTIIYTITGSCGSAAATMAITVNPLPSAGTISGPSSECFGTPAVLTESVGGGMWLSSDLSIATVDSVGNVAGVVPGPVTIMYTVSNGCGSDTAFFPFSFDFHALPIFGAETVCQFNVITLIEVTPGGTWSSSNPLVAIVFGGTVIGITAGVTTITYTVTNACGTSTVTKKITVVNCVLENQAITKVDDRLDVYPNPNNGFVNINLQSASDEQVQVVITNVVGEKVKEFTTQTNRANELNFDVPTGIYMVTVETAHGRYMAKVVVQR